MQTKGTIMRVLGGIVVLCGLVFGEPSGWGQAVGGAPEATIRVERATLGEVERDRITFLATVSVLPEQTLRVARFSFAKMTVNGMPVYVGPLEGKFTLKRGVSLTLPEVRMVVYERDVASMAPLREAVERERVLLSGEITVKLESTALQDLALRSLHPVIVLPFSREIAVSVPGGELGRRAALTALDLAAQIPAAAGKLLGGFFPGEDAAWRKDVTERQARHVVVIRTAYRVMTKETSAPIVFEQMGFWIGPSTVLTTDEAIAPWEFDPEVQAALAADHGRIEKGSISISVHPLVGGGAPEWRMEAGDFRITVSGRAEESKEAYAPTLAAVKVRQRGSANNYAVLRFRDGLTGEPMQMAAQMDGGVDRVAMLRMVRGPGAGFEAVLLPATIEGRQVRFAQPVDESAYGSAAMTSDGAIALVQDQGSGTLLTEMKRVEREAK